MPRLTYSTIVETDTAVVTTAETVVATLTGVSTYGPNRTVKLTGEAVFTTGTATTALTWRVRRDSLTGTLVHEANAVQVEAVAGSTEDHDIYAEDPRAAEIANATYVLTVQQTAATANGSALRASLVAEID